MSVAAVVLAAGGSRRLGQPKQLVLWKGEALVRRAARLALEAGCRPVRVVLGAEAEACRQALAGLDVEPILNPAWGEGMASSLRAGIRQLPEEAEAILLLACDQPHLEVSHLAGLLAVQAAGPEATVASAYGGVRGVPALFPRRRLPELAALEGDRGARALLAGPEVREVPFPGGAFDLDAPEDLERLRR